MASRYTETHDKKMPGQKKQKIAILGGGISSLAAAFDLTSEKNWEQKYDITVYQMGWRLGGKGASTRNPEYGNRIEEHGLHVWLGFYENAFQIMRRCYSELPAQSRAFKDWTKAFKPHDYIVLEEFVDDKWQHWPITFPSNSASPGVGEPLPSLWDYVEMAIHWLKEAVKELPESQRESTSLKLSASSTLVLEKNTIFKKISATLTPKNFLLALEEQVSKVKKARKPAARLNELIPLLDDLTQWKFEVTALFDDPKLRRIFIPIDLMSAVLRGMLTDNVLIDGLDVLDEFEFREWIERHGASKVSLESAWLRSGYDLAFSYEGGDSNKPNMAAGVAVRSIFRAAFSFKGAGMWTMQAGMGETIFSPLYLLLKERGVKFKFFHKVETLELSADKRSIAAIRMNVQATVRQGEYQPLKTFGGFDCWTHKPDYAQLVEGNELEQSGVNLESNWIHWPGTESVLKSGEDFDAIILGIPIAALKTICRELIEHRSDWRLMVENVKTIQTQAFQLWFNQTTADLGWNLDKPILGAYVDPIDTWADMTHLLSVEEWQEPKPKQIAYFCGVMPDPENIPPTTELNFPATEHARTRAVTVDFLDKSSLHLWPKSRAAEQDTFNWDYLHATGVGEARLEEQYWRANIDPSERYTLAVKGSTKFRLRPDQSGFSNLILAGDWLRNGLNLPGCIESAVLSGRQAARAISHSKASFIGETDIIKNSLLDNLIAGLRSMWAKISALFVIT